jgi:hypothetical protein
MVLNYQKNTSQLIDYQETIINNQLITNYSIINFQTIFYSIWLLVIDYYLCGYWFSCDFVYLFEYLSFILLLLDYARRYKKNRS